ncbi:exported hypothetical protein [Sphingomonas sp. EC-HK361]|uniref:hypothetical protein n=1 Tax=Sphingomonas sp. EC-HK361 TaxID=2038397 RepID=UPI001253C3A5|nr:hypothetical protein [Sphingomonas sp. EC-HK361]VVT23776.1 exported hypothetical protein [Sphingomonas sp. EC-HK361]
MARIFNYPATVALTMAGLLVAATAEARPAVSKAAGMTRADLDQWVSGPQPADERERLLTRALAAPEQRRVGKQHYCIDDRWSNPAAVRRVCRTRADWHRLGIEPQV